MIKPDTKKVMASRRWETEERFRYETRPAIAMSSPKYRHKEKSRFINTMKLTYKQLHYLLCTLLSVSSATD
jgi:hypothetical protein